MKYVLIFSDGESIEAETCETRKEAHEKMVKSYEEYYPEDQDETWADMSYLGEDSALLYLNGDGTCCWSIYAVQSQQPGRLKAGGNLGEKNMSKILCHPEDDTVWTFISRGSRCICGSNCFHYRDVDGVIAGYCNACGRLRGYPTTKPDGLWITKED